MLKRLWYFLGKKKKTLLLGNYAVTMEKLRNVFFQADRRVDGTRREDGSLEKLGLREHDLR